MAGLLREVSAEADKKVDVEVGPRNSQSSEDQPSINCKQVVDIQSSFGSHTKAVFMVPIVDVHSELRNRGDSDQSMQYGIPDSNGPKNDGAINNFALENSGELSVVMSDDARSASNKEKETDSSFNNATENDSSAGALDEGLESIGSGFGLKESASSFVSDTSEHDALDKEICLRSSSFGNGFPSGLRSSILFKIISFYFKKISIHVILYVLKELSLTCNYFEKLTHFIFSSIPLLAWLSGLSHHSKMSSSLNNSFQQRNLFGWLSRLV